MGSVQALSVSSENSQEDGFVLVDILVPLSDANRLLGVAVLDIASRYNFIKEDVLNRVPSLWEELETRAVEEEVELGASTIKVRQRVRFRFIMEYCAFSSLTAFFWVIPQKDRFKADILIGKKTTLRSNVIRDNRMPATT